MKRPLYFDRPGRDKPSGDLAYIPSDGMERRQARRERPRLDESDRAIKLVWAVAELVQDEQVSAGCIQGGKLRPNRLYAECYLLQTLKNYRPRHIAAVYHLPVRFVYNAARKGRAIVEDLAYSGKLDGLLESDRTD